MKGGYFIAIDGIDGCGSTTQTRLLGEHLKSRELKVHLTKEPSELEIGTLIRKFLKMQDIPSATDALLFAADRIQHYYNEILPKLREGFIVISDRYLESSIAYQTAQLMKDDGNKVVLVSRTGYSPAKDQILLDLIAEPIALLSVVGQDCQKWEDVMDELCVGDGANPVSIHTTSHPDESVEEVAEFATQFSVEDDRGVRIIET